MNNGNEALFVDCEIVSTKKQNSRCIIYLEILRMIAVFFVLFNHTGQDGFLLFVKERESFFYPMYLLLSLFDKIAVPLFFMVSGALLLHKEEPIKNIYRKRIPRILIVLLLTSFIFYFEKCSFDIKQVNVGEFFLSIYQKPIHTRLWYLYTYVGLLIALPLLRKLANAMGSKEYRYLIIAHVLLYGIVPVAEYLIGKGTVKLSTRFDFGIIVSYNSFFFLLGHYFERIADKELYNRKKVLLLVLLGLVGIVIGSIATHCYMIWENTKDPQKFHNSLVSLPAIAVFVSVKHICEKVNIGQTVKRIIQIMGSATFGVYLFDHWFRNWTRGVFTFLKPMIGTLPACGIWIFCACLLGTLLITIIKKIPLIRSLI